MDDLDTEIHRASEAIRAEAVRIANSEAALDAVKRIATTPSPYRSRVLHRRRPIIAAAAAVLVAAVGLILFATRDRHERIVVNNGTTSVPAVPTTSALPTITTRDIAGPVNIAPGPPPDTSFFTLPDVGAPWFISRDEGWVLGRSDNSSTPTMLLHTTDGGGHWTVVGPVPVGTKCLDLPRPLRFADPHNGWILGCDLFSTHDGGTTWNQLPLGGAWAVEFSQDRVHVVVGQREHRIIISPIDHDDFVDSGVVIPAPPGTPRDVHLAVGASTGVAIVTDGIQFGGARLDHGQWVPWTPPCEGSGGATLPAATPSSDEIVHACTTPGSYNATSADRATVSVYVSHDGGQTFHEAAQPLPAPAGSTATSIALPAEGHIVVSLHDGDSSVLIASDDDGASWHQLAVSSAGKLPPTQSGDDGDFRDLEFTTTNDGAGRVNNSVAVTHDGGRRWTTVLG